MGLFTPKITRAQLEFVSTTLTQVQDCAKLINSTIKPDVFFGRLNFILDLLLRLQPYEKYGIFKGGTPTSDYNRLIANMNATVDDFITRAVEANDNKVAALKTDKAKKRNRENFAIKLISAFDCANTFWTGDRNFPHYDGKLFTVANYQRVQAIYDALEE